MAKDRCLSFAFAERFRRPKANPVAVQVRLHFPLIFAVGSVQPDIDDLSYRMAQVRSVGMTVMTTIQPPLHAKGDTYLK